MTSNQQNTRSAITSHRFHKFWLKITAIVVGSFGPVFFLGTMLPTSEPARWTLDLLSWPLDGLQTYASPDTRFLSALTGGFLLGWGVLIWCLSAWVYDVAPEPVRRSVLIGLIAWLKFPHFAGESVKQLSPSIPVQSHWVRDSLRTSACA
jgi:hypothetical protein